jgi:CBS domain-containing protein
MEKHVREVMSANLISIGVAEPVGTAARLMREHEIGSLPVVDDDGRLVGMLTDRDIATRVAAERRDAESVTDGEVASGGRMVTTAPGERLDEAVRLMARHQVRRLPVTERGVLVGILAQADVAGAGDRRKVGEMVDAISAAKDEQVAHTAAGDVPPRDQHTG